jgi:hypothetical protein
VSEVHDVIGCALPYGYTVHKVSIKIVQTVETTWVVVIQNLTTFDLVTCWVRSFVN